MGGVFLTELTEFFQINGILADGLEGIFPVAKFTALRRSLGPYKNHGFKARLWGCGLIGRSGGDGASVATTEQPDG